VQLRDEFVAGDDSEPEVFPATNARGWGVAVLGAHVSAHAAGASGVVSLYTVTLNALQDLLLDTRRHTLQFASDVMKERYSAYGNCRSCQRCSPRYVCCCVMLERVCRADDDGTTPGTGDATKLLDAHERLLTVRELFCNPEFQACTWVLTPLPVAACLSGLPCFRPSCLPAFLPSCLPAFLPSCLPAFLPSCLPAFLPSCLPALLLAHARVVRLRVTITVGAQHGRSKWCSDVVRKSLTFATSLGTAFTECTVGTQLLR
jgi:hypothetical protein